MIRVWLLTLASLTALATAYPTLAQDAEQAQVSPAAAKAEGDRIIAAAHTGDLFENITGNNGGTRIRHKASGMTCSFDPVAAGNNVRIYPPAALTPNRGDNVSCSGLITYQATRYQPMPSEAQDMASSVAEIRNTWSDIEPLEGEFGVATGAGRPEPLFTALQGRSPDGTEAAVFVIITHVDGWSFKTETSGPLEQAELIATAASLFSVASIPPRD